MSYTRNELLNNDNVLRCYTNLDFVRGKPITETVCYLNGNKYKRNLIRKGRYPLTEKAALNMIVRQLESQGKTMENIQYRELDIG